MLGFCDVCDNSLVLRVQDGTVAQQCTVCNTEIPLRKGVHVMWETVARRDDSVDHYMNDLIHHDPTIPYIRAKCRACGVTGRVRYVKKFKDLSFLYSCESCRAFWTSDERGA